MESQQKKLYDNFLKEAEIHKDPIIRERCKKAAAEILKSFPQFAKKKEKEKTDSKEDKEQK